MSSTAICRRATMKDHKAIIEMDNMVYNGVDYLDANYPLYMQQPYRFCFLCEDNGKVMAYSQQTLVDGGKTLIGQAGRSRPGHRGEGYFKMLINYVNEQIKILCPSVERRVYTAVYGEFHQKREVNFIEKRNRQTFKLTPEQSLCEIHCFMNQPTVYRITPYELEAIVEEDCKNGWKIFPAKSLTSEWEPMSMIDGVKSNVQIIAYRSLLFASYDINGKCVAVSALNGYTITRGRRSDCDFYGPNLNHLQAHMIAHAKEAHKKSQKVKCDLYFCVHFPLSISPEKLNV
ncbi:unnamed protein product, partial [Owenia fusiformis]